MSSKPLPKSVKTTNVPKHRDKIKRDKATTNQRQLVLDTVENESNTR